jgi:membrane-associated HD superfamily phosphohydrolase
MKAGEAIKRIKQAVGMPPEERGHMETKGSSLKRYRVIDFIWEIMVFSIILTAFWLTERLMGRPVHRVIADMVMAALGLGAVGLMLRMTYLHEQLDYDNDKHLHRFWVMFLIGGGIALLCGVLPVGGWPYVVIYIALALYGTQSLGILSASVLLMLSIIVKDGDVSAFMIYFICGIVGTILFRKLESDMKVMIPLLISQMVLFVCETAYLLVQHPSGIESELFVIPFVNVVVSSVMLIGILKLFFSGVLLKEKYIYCDLLNPEGSQLSDFKGRNRESYYLCMHTAYFCDRIARKLGLNPDPVKTAGFYQKIGTILKEDDTGKEHDPAQAATNRDKQVVSEKKGSTAEWEIVERYLLKNKFPEKARSILKEYLVEGERIVSKEATILIFADAVVSSVSYLFSKDPKIHPDFDKLVEGVFRKGLDSGLLIDSSLTQRELTQMRKIFKEEKLYYDFIRGK